MTVSTPPATDIDLFSDEVLRDPYPAYATLRDQGAVVHMQRHDIWALTRYDAVREAVATPGTFSSTGVGFNDVVNGAIAETALASDPPDHAPRRQALAQSLSPKNLRGLKDHIETKVDDLVADLIDRATFDAVDDFAEVLPTSIVLDLIGLNADMQATVLPWAAEAFNTFGPLSKERTLNSLPVAGALAEFCSAIDPDDLTEGSFGRTAFDAAARGDLTRADAEAVVTAYIGAGLDTTIAALGHAIRLFADNPEQWDILRADTTRIPAAFNEILRIESPLQMLGRRTTKDVDIEGVVIPAGASVAMLYGCANRDERHYPDPTTFNINRDASDHLAFGYGIHSCAGQGLARMEVFAALSALASRVHRFHVGEPVMGLNNTSRSLQSLPVVGLDLL